MFRVVSSVVVMSLIAPAFAVREDGLSDAPVKRFYVSAVKREAQRANDAQKTATPTVTPKRFVLLKNQKAINFYSRKNSDSQIAGNGHSPIAQFGSFPEERAAMDHSLLARVGGWLQTADQIEKGAFRAAWSLAPVVCKSALCIGFGPFCGRKLLKFALGQAMKATVNYPTVFKEVVFLEGVSRYPGWVPGVRELQKVIGTLVLWPIAGIVVDHLLPSLWQGISSGWNAIFTNVEPQRNPR